MPIRHCQLCGIKVIVDEDKASVFPFYCDLCSTKTQMGMSAPGGAPPPTAPPPAPVTPTTTNAPTPPSIPAVGSPDLSCPSCSASLAAKPGDRPVKMRCPGCGAELAVLPSGAVNLIQGEDPLRFAKTQEVKVDEGTEGLKAKIRQIMDREKAKKTTAHRAAVPAPAPAPKVVIKAPAAQAAPPPPPPPPPPPASPPPPPIPAPPRKTPISNPKMSMPPPSNPEPVPLDELPKLPMEGAAATDGEAERIPSELRSGFISETTESAGGHTEDLASAPPPPPEPPLPPEPEAPPPPPVPEKDEDLSNGFVPPTGPADEPESAPEPPAPKFKGPKVRRIPFIMAVLLLVVPIVGAVVGPGMITDPSQQEMIQKVGNVLIAGTNDIVEYVNREPEPLPEPTTPNPTQKKDEGPRVEPGEIVDEYKAYLKASMGLAENDDQDTMSDMEDRVRVTKRAYDKLVEIYRKQNKKAEPPTKTELVSALDDTLNDLYVKRQFVKMNMNTAKRTSPQMVPTLQANFDRIDQIYNALDNDYSALTGSSYKVRDINEEPDEDPEVRKARKKAELQDAYQNWQAQQEKVDALGDNALSLDRTLLRVAQQKYNELKDQYEAEFGETFKPE